MRIPHLPRLVVIAAALGVLTIAGFAAVTSWSGLMRHSVVSPPAKHVVHPKVPPAPAKPPKPSAFALEQAMSYRELMRRWDGDIVDASKRFNVPEGWIRAVMEVESGGRTMLAEGKPMVSSQGAMGLMQLMPETYQDMRLQYGLGADPFDPHDNIFAGAAYLRWLRGRYGYPTMFAAYNDGPGNLEARLQGRGLLPAETTNYVGSVTQILSGVRGGKANRAIFTRPNGSPVSIDCATVSSVRAPFPGEFADGVKAVLAVGKLRQGVTETLARTRSIVRTHGGAG